MKDFTLVSLLKLILNKIWIILLVSIIVAAISFGYFQYFVQPTYMSTAIIITSNGGITDASEEDTGTIKSADLASSFNLIPTYVGILKTDEVFNRVAAKSGSGYTASQIKGKISVSSRSDVELFIDISVVDEDPEKARMIADCFVDEGSKYILEMLPNGYAKPLQHAKAGAKNYPQPIRMSVLSFLVAAFAVVLVYVVLSFFDRRLKNEEDFKSTYKYPVLGVVPDYADAAKGDK